MSHPVDTITVICPLIASLSLSRVGVGAEIAILFSQALVLSMTCFMRQKDKSTMFLLLLLFLDPTLTKAAHVWSRTGCPEGKTQKVSIPLYHNIFLKGQIFWQEDQTCHRPFYQGPCNKGHILIDHPQVPRKI